MGLVFQCVMPQWHHLLFYRVSGDISFALRDTTRFQPLRKKRTPHGHPQVIPQRTTLTLPHGLPPADAGRSDLRWDFRSDFRCLSSPKIIYLGPKSYFNYFHELIYNVGPSCQLI